MLRVSIDGKTIFEVTDANAGGYQKYNQVIRDVSTYADGGIHTLEIFAEVNGNHQSTTSFFVDDVVLILTGNTTPTPSAEPTSTGQPSSLQPTAGPESTNQPALTLYFAPSNGSLLIPVTRSVSSPSDLNPETALAELFRGPQPGSGLVRLIPSDVTVLSLQQQNSNVTVNLDQQIDNDLALRSIAHTLTALPGVNSVQFQVDGVDVGLQGNDRPLLRPQLNPDNPEQLSGEFGSRTRFCRSILSMMTIVCVLLALYHIPWILPHARSKNSSPVQAAMPIVYRPLFHRKHGCVLFVPMVILSLSISMKLLSMPPIGKPRSVHWSYRSPICKTNVSNPSSVGSKSALKEKHWPTSGAKTMIVNLPVPC